MRGLIWQAMPKYSVVLCWLLMSDLVDNCCNTLLAMSDLAGNADIDSEYSDCKFMVLN